MDEVEWARRPGVLNRPMEDMTDVLEAARDTYIIRTGLRLVRLEAAHSVGELSADDLYALGDAAWWLGLIDESLAAYEARLPALLDEGSRPPGGPITALAIGYTLALRGDGAVGSGWMGRAARLLEDEPECAEHGYLLYLLEVESALDGTDLDAAIARPRADPRAMGRRLRGPHPGRARGARRGPGAGQAGAGRATVWPCWTRRCWRCSSERWTRPGPATSTAT